MPRAVLSDKRKKTQILKRRSGFGVGCPLTPTRLLGREEAAGWGWGRGGEKTGEEEDSGRQNEGRERKY